MSCFSFAKPKRLILSCFTVLLACARIGLLHAQTPEIKWSYVIDGYNDTDITDLVVDEDGNTYASINFSGPIEFKDLGVDIKKYGYPHGLILKLDKLGKAVWVRAIYSASDNRINDIALAPNGDILFTGFGDGVMQFPGNLDTLKIGIAKTQGDLHQPQTLYGARYSKDGERIWVKSFETPFAEGLCIGANSKNEVFMSFYFNGFVKLNGQLLDTLPRDREIRSVGLLVQLAEDGGFEKVLYRDELKSKASTPRHRFKIDKNDNLYAYGLFTKKIKFSNTDSLTNDEYNEGTDSYLVKYNAQGELQWTRKVGGQHSQHLNEIDFDETGSIYGAGQYTYECIIGDGVSIIQKSLSEHKSGDSFFYFKMFDNGELAFACYEEQGNYITSFFAQSIDIDLNNEAHILGYYSDTINLEGVQLSLNKYATGGFYSHWNQNTFQELEAIGFISKADWIYPKTFDSNNIYFSAGIFYYGDSCGIYVNNEPVRFGNFKYGRASVIYGGELEDKKEQNSSLAALEVKVDYLNRLKPLLACTNPKEASLPNIWYPTIDSIPSRDSWLSESPCGRKVEKMEAQLFPNPSRGQTNLKLIGLNGGTTQIDVFSQEGKLIYSQQISLQTSDYELGLDLGSSANGIYFIRVTYGGFEKAIRFVKVD